MKIKKQKRNGSWKDFLLVLRKGNLPWIWIILAFISSILFNQSLLLIPNTTASLLNGKLEAKAVWGTVQFYVLFTIVSCVWNALTAIACTRSVQRARGKLWDKMLRVKVSYYDQNDPATLMSAITTDLSSGMKDVVYLFINLLPTIYYVIAALVTIGNYHWGLVIAVLVLLPFKYIYALLMGRASFRSNARVYSRIGSLTGYLAERIRNLPLIKTYTNEKQELENGTRVSKELQKANMSVIKVSSGISALETFFQFAQEFLAMVIAVVLLQRGLIDMPQWVAFFLFSTSLSSSFSALINQWFNLKRTHGAITRAAEIFVAPEENTSIIGDCDLPNKGLDITFDHVTFSYDDKPALKDVSFTIPYGSSIAIVGLCGSGKTTSLSLLERFYSTEKGEVRLAGIPVNKLTLGEYRKRFAYVQQRPEVFSGTVREALTYGLEREVSDSEILKAAKISGFMTYLDLQPNGLDTVVAPSGTSMSGGQRQRLVLAREFLRGADILLLDEPTSALDAESSQAIQDAIFTMFPDKTKILVTHDLKLTQQVDQIVVLEEGVLVGNGRYEDLLESCPLFKEMVEMQAQEVTAEW